MITDPPYNVDYTGKTKDALKISNKLNQESIIWKDENFFGMLTCKDGNVDFEFSNDDQNMNFIKEAAQKYDYKVLSMRLLEILSNIKQ